MSCFRRRQLECFQTVSHPIVQPALIGIATSIDIAQVRKAVAADEHQPLKVRDGTLMTLVVILVVLWLLGMVTTYTLGGLLHILLVIAIVLLLVRVIQGRAI
jgi:hypothetical protein